MAMDMSMRSIKLTRIHIYGHLDALAFFIAKVPNNPAAGMGTKIFKTRKTKQASNLDDYNTNHR